VRTSVAALLALALLCLPACGHAEDGHELWLRYAPLEGAALGRARAMATQLVAGTGSPTLDAAHAELTRALGRMLGAPPAPARDVTRDGAIVLGTPRSLASLRDPALDPGDPGPEGYRLRTVRIHGHRATAIIATSDIGVLYGTFALLRLLQTQVPLADLDVLARPALQHRLLDHWDDLDRFVERGYAGASIWDWQKLPDYLDPRYTDYARACASVGINGTVLNNVNASALILTPRYLEKIGALAAVLRPYGMRVYLSARFSAPIEIGGLKTADPLDPTVRAWWQAKIDEIYRAVPDFGGFLVKANSEDQPGPQDYHRSHADGANLFARALRPHGGIVMWRAFVYSSAVPEDRARQAYTELHPLDGQFDDNVLLQVKNGPIDFQPREPFHPLFGAMPRTPLMLEVQITKEYLGFATHLAYLGTMWEETLHADTRARGAGSTVAHVIDGSLDGHSLSGMAGVANVGTDRNWTGSHFDQANWYAFGRMAWDPALSAAAIAEEWVRMTFSSDPVVVAPVVHMMMVSREAVVDYMTPLGLHHLMATGSHYGPGPWVATGLRADQTPAYFHNANAQGIGFDRTASGSNAIAQYAPAVAEELASLEKTPDTLLLWFHHVPWDHRMASGRTLWEELVLHYTQGVETVGAMRRTWAGLAAHIDAERHAQVAQFLAIQEQEAQGWRDASIAYFQSLSHRPLPPGVTPPAHSLAEYEAICVPYVPGHRGPERCAR
jgi:alpha-glucuronidase